MLVRIEDTDGRRNSAHNGHNATSRRVSEWENQQDVYRMGAEERRGGTRLLRCIYQIGGDYIPELPQAVLQLAIHPLSHLLQLRKLIPVKAVPRGKHADA